MFLWLLTFYSNRSKWTFYFLSSVQFNFTIGGNEIFKLLVKLNNKGKTIVIVTHDIELAQKCPRVVVLSNKE